MTTLLNDECEGITAFPNTLIGMFFKQTAVQELCAGIQVTTVSADGADPSTTAIVESTSVTPLRSSSKSSSATVETATMTDTSTASTLEPTTTLSTQTSVVASSTENAGQIPDDIAPTAASDGSPVTRPTATQGSSSNPDRNNGATGADSGNNSGNGGTVIEAASIGNIRSIHVLSPIAACLALMMLAL
ncbi:MAG: hypothetical protein Q9209_007662 [Squamulea sp. 1 TL-2023]